uniref:LOB domain-containing protein n=1 Tax=Kalanchoe fedtschenkoi TaxID=63787 RepID=A0A7N0T6X0_KALFE
MESSSGKTAPPTLSITPTTFNSSLSSSSSPPLSHSSPSTLMLPPPQSQVIVMSPCAACKILRRRCDDKCLLAPYFPPSDPLKFTIAHRVFGASNIIKFLQELPESQRADAVSSMVYEGTARLRDPVYGCAGAICHLQRQVSELQAELAKAHAEILTIQVQKENRLASICTDDDQDQPTTISYGQCADVNQNDELYGVASCMDPSVRASNLESLWHDLREF